MAVPLLDLNIQNLALEAELKAAFERVLKSGYFILGPEIDAFEKEVAAMIGAKHAISVSSGTDAILLALMALDLKPGDEVICPSFTFFATAGCVARAGAVPVFVDSCPVSFNIDPQDIERKITARTKAVMPVHLFGQCADMDPVLAIARKHGLTVIEDGAQALGSSYKGRSAGTMGTFGTFSFFPSKNLGGFGDSGMLVSDDDALAEKSRLLRTHGSKPKYYHKFVGANFRMDPMQAALLRVKMPHYSRYTSCRQVNAADYTNRLSSLSGVVTANVASQSLEVPAGTKFVLPATSSDYGHIWNQYTIRVLGDGKRDALKKFLGEKGIGCEIYYPVPMHQQECFAYLKPPAGTCPVATQLAKEVISIPIYPELKPEQREEVVAALAAFVA